MLPGRFTAFTALTTVADMASQFDDSDFIDRDYQAAQGSFTTAKHSPSDITFRPPSRQELDTRVGAAQQKLAELKRAQEQLERERTALEEARRRRLEYQTGREEMLQNLTRGVALMDKAESDARRNAEQLAKTLARLREALTEVDRIQEDTWTEENWNTELTKALASIENSRMEWNRARLSWPLLNGQAEGVDAPKTSAAVGSPWEGRSFWELCKFGAAMTWPVALVGLIGVIAVIYLGWQ